MVGLHFETHRLLNSIIYSKEKSKNGNIILILLIINVYLSFYNLWIQTVSVSSRLAFKS
jgi:hypothetical protein